MPKYDFDFFVIGAGSAGTRASRIAAGHGARVAVAEDRYLGGTCVNVGCVPKKLLVYASHFSEEFEDAAGFGWTVGERRHDWKTLIEHKNREIARLNGVYQRLIEGAGATIIDGRARLKDRHTVVIGERAYSADKILIATGGWPVVPEFPGSEHVITSNEAFFLESLPERIVVVGGGFIGVEFAGIFHGLGAQVTELYRGPMFLRGFDDDCRAHLADEMRKKGIDLRFNADIAHIDRHGDHLVIGLKDGTALDADLVMYATGRAPATKGIGLEDAGVTLNEFGAVVVDDKWRSSVDNIYAVGDVTDRINLTPVAIAEGHAVADMLFNPSGRSISYDNVPSTVFSQPNLAAVGLTEAHARVKLGAVDIYRSTFTPMKHTLSGRNEKSLMKLVVERATQKVVGVHMVGADAGEIIQGFAVAVQMGATKADLDCTIGIHPTAAEEFVTMRNPVPETVKEAAE